MSTFSHLFCHNIAVAKNVTSKKLKCPLNEISLSKGVVLFTVGLLRQVVLVQKATSRVVSHILSAPNRGKRNKNTFQSHISTKWVEKCSVTRL